MISADLIPTTETVSLLTKVMVTYDGLSMPFLDALKQYYQRLPQALKSNDLKLVTSFKQRWGEEIIRYLCVPLHLADDECVVTAIIAARAA